MTLHPATLLVLWGGFVLFTQSLGPVFLGVATLLGMPVAMAFSRHRTITLLRRTRWLILSIVLLFLFAVPGERLPGWPGDIGITYDGLALAAEHCLRLVLLLASLALLHERLGNIGMMSGLYWLLAPLAGWRTLRERIVVRLMLVLDYVERPPTAGWRGWLGAEDVGPESMDLAVRQARGVDWLVLAAVILASATLEAWRPG